MNFRLNTIIYWSPICWKIARAMEVATREIVKHDYVPTLTRGLDPSHKKGPETLPYGSVLELDNAKALNFLAGDIPPFTQEMVRQRIQRILGPEFAVEINYGQFLISLQAPSE